MIRVIILLTLLGIAVTLPACGSGHSTSPGGDTPPEDDYTIPPYDILRHGLDLEGVWANEAGSVTVGEMGLAFLTVPEGRFLLPVPTTATLTDVWVTPDGTIFITAESGGGLNSRVLWYRDGQIHAYSSGATPFKAVRGVHPHGWLPVFASTGGTVFWFDGYRWEVLPDVAPTPILDLWPLSTGDMWASTTSGVSFYGGASHAFSTIHYDGSWYEGISGVAVDSVMTIGGPPGTWRIWKLNQDDEFEPVYNSSSRLYDICWFEQDYAFAVGAEGTTVEMSGADWIPRHVDPPVDLKAVAPWKQGDDRFAVAVGDSGGVFNFSAGQWTGGSSPKITCTELMGISPSLMFALHDGRLMEYDGNWHALPEAGLLTLHDFFCLDEDTVWAVGKRDLDTFTARYDGAAWSTQWLNSLEGANDIWAADNDHVFIACDIGTVYSSAGFWAPMIAVQPVQNLHGVWGASPTSVYVVGDGGAIGHWDGSSWTTMDSGTDANLTAVWGSADNNVVAAGHDGVVIRYDGVSWASLESRLEDAITMLWCDGPDNIWVVSEAGDVEHHDGTGWEERNPQLDPIGLTGIWGQGEDLFILAEHDFLLRYQPPPAELEESLTR
jgi:hypothetical protein